MCCCRTAHGSTRRRLIGPSCTPGVRPGLPLRSCRWHRRTRYHGGPQGRVEHAKEDQLRGDPPQRRRRLDEIDLQIHRTPLRRGNIEAFRPALCPSRRTKGRGMKRDRPRCSRVAHSRGQNENEERSPGAARAAGCRHSAEIGANDRAREIRLP